MNVFILILSGQLRKLKMKNQGSGRVFGENLLNKFHVGDLVSWTPIGHQKQIGIILNITIEKATFDLNREFIFVEVLAPKNQKRKFLLTTIELIESFIKDE